MDSWNTRFSRGRSLGARIRNTSVGQGRENSGFSGRSSSINRDARETGRGRGSGRGFSNYKDNFRSSSDELHSKSDSRDGGPHRNRASSRMYPIGIKKLQELQERNNYIISEELLRKNSGYQQFLKEKDMREFKLCLVLNLLNKASSTRANTEGVVDLLLLTFNSANFRQNLTSFISNEVKYDEDKALEYLPVIGEILSQFARLTPANAFQTVSQLTDICVGALQHVKSEGASSMKDVEQLFENLKLLVKESRVRFKQSQKPTKHKILQPPDNYRDLEVMPTPEEITLSQRPFIRPAVVEGGYENSDHYLDVQFRLLKEDFMRPLREGLANYLNEKDYRKLDVRVYRDVQFYSSEIDRSNLIYYLKLNVKNNFRIENTKRLMYGNMLCLSHDDFKTITMATVCSRDYLKDKLLGVKLESEPFTLNHNLKYVVVESKAYFVSYKYTLEAIKKLDEVPLKNYIVYAKETDDHPSYLQRFTRYEIPKNLKDCSWKKKIVDYIVRFGRDLRKDVLEEDVYDVCLLDEIRFWPSFNELGFDQSQRRAFHGALTRQMAIIQGPPGTGKTYVGLKITQVLLHNKNIWSNANKRPILVVCYTNHALDQFLEGMMSFTRNIVRIGSQSKNEDLKEFQINKLLLRHSSVTDDFTLDTRYHDIRFEVKGLRQNIDRMSEIVKNINESGIIDIRCFIAYDIIPPQQLELILSGKSVQSDSGDISPSPTMEYWLFDSLYESEMKTYDFMPDLTCNDHGNMFSTENGEDERGPDGDTANVDEVDDEIMKEEEYARKLDEDEDEEDQNVPINRDNMSTAQICYWPEIKLEDINKIVRQLQSSIEQDPFNKDIREHYETLKRLLAEYRTIETGCKLAVAEQEGQRLEHVSNIWDLNLIERWKLYNYWKEKLLKEYKELKLNLEFKHIELTNKLLKLKDLKYLSIMKQSGIVGMTTTGAAQYSDLLHDLGPEIVIVEEAAEILEAHVVSSLSAKCQHLILIGDHKQLRPKANVYELGAKYNLEISLFERMIKNNVRYETLEFQHRMKPVFSQLLVPIVYEELKDDPSVFDYPKVKGIYKDFFFIDHTEMENAPTIDNESFENIHEARFIMGLCRHLILQGYASDDITILTPYSGQHFSLRKLQRENEFEPCNKVRISILDNYQGEECNIILLSLVRSNMEGKVGFMKEDNRVCVALSRAKHGMYIIGNMSQMMEASRLWKDINQKLTKSEHIGPALRLVCGNHPTELIMVSSYNDFLSKTPEGGCKQQCLARLPECNHSCPRLCHVIDSDHKTVRCTEKCEKIALNCTVGHICPLLCFQLCRDCEVLMEKQLPCGHVHSVPCAIPANDFKCKTKVTKELFCKHTVRVSCYMDISNIKCSNPCTTRLDCGHQCKKLCHVQNDPEHENYDCHEACEKTPENCERNHKCLKKCYEDCGRCTNTVTKNLNCGHTVGKVACGVPEDEIVCPSQCKKVLSCGHPCPRKCGDLCGGCKLMVHKVVPECQHTIKVECSIPPTISLCAARCIKVLPCGHNCKKKCLDICSSSSCQELITSNYKCPKGHIVKLPCEVSRNNINFNEGITALTEKTVGEYCTNICGVMLDCGHQCKGQCGECLNGRLHACCREKCTRTLVCGHVCTEPCSTDCPPCQQPCLWRCSHSKCMKKCGVMCIGCQERCDRGCVHSQCTAKCGDICKSDPCSEPCPKKLKCSHECIGFCGEPCPKQCRICDKDEITDIFFGDEDEDDARFIMLEDCKHALEAEGLKHWMNTPATSEDGRIEIGMKKCPRCSVAIYNTKRFQNVILEAYNMVQRVKSKYYSSKKKIQKSELTSQLKDLNRDWPAEVAKLQKNLCLDVNFRVLRRQRPISDEQYALYSFQVNFLKAARNSRASLEGKETRLKNLISVVMKPTLSISSQMMEELSCELRRLEKCALVEKVRYKAFNDPVKRILNEIETIMNPTIKFDVISEKKVTDLLKKSEQYIGTLGITDKERLQIVSAIGLSPGHWYKCPNGHVYVIADCGGAVVESVCPECKAKIGGTSHRLRSDNRLATEMDGAARSAWPGGY